MYQQLKDLQEEFKETHKASEKFKSQLISPTEIKKAIMQMEEDKSMLEQKVEGLANKLHGTERFDEMLEASRKLRLEQDEQVKLIEALALAPRPLAPAPNPSPSPNPSPNPNQVKLMERLKEQKSLMLQAEHRLNQMDP